jgi:hypothetical protein
MHSSTRGDRAVGHATRTRRLAPILAAIAAGWCVVAAIWIWNSALSRQSVTAAASLLVVPTAIPAAAIWAARRPRQVLLAILVALFGLFCFVTGFSIGGFYLPALALLVWTVVVAIQNREGDDG